MKVEKDVSFFRKLIISIKDFERYPELASKKWPVVLSYLIKLLVVFTVVVSFVVTYEVSKKIQDGLEYIGSEIPEFTFYDQMLKVNSESPIIKEDMDNLFDTMIIDTFLVNNDTLQTYKEMLQKSGNGVAFLQDKVLLKTNMTTEIVEYDYKTIAEAYEVGDFNKEELLQYFSKTNLSLIYIAIFIISVIYMFLIYSISILLDIVSLSILGFFTALLMRLHIKVSAMSKIAIHSLTLPILLNAIVILIEAFTSFRIKYFEIMYIGISYIYIITAILMIKSDIIKNQKELVKIIEEQEKVRMELERQKEEEESKKQEEKREKEKEKQRKKEKKKGQEDNGQEEPQGENA